MGWPRHTGMGHDSAARGHKARLVTGQIGQAVARPQCGFGAFRGGKVARFGVLSGPPRHCVAWGVLLSRVRCPGSSLGLVVPAVIALPVVAVAPACRRCGHTTKRRGATWATPRPATCRCLPTLCPARCALHSCCLAQHAHARCHMSNAGTLVLPFRRVVGTKRKLHVLRTTVSLGLAHTRGLPCRPRLVDGVLDIP